MSSKNKKNKQARRQQLELARKALTGEVPSLKELEKQLGPEEFARRCEKLLTTIFETEGRGKVMTAAGLKAKARAHVEKSQELYRNCCEEFYKALDCLFTLSVRVDESLKNDVTLGLAYGRKAAPELGLGYGMGVKNMKKTVEAGKKPITNRTSRPMGDPKADKAKPDATAEKHTAERRPQRHTRLPASVRLTPHEIALNLGSFMTKELAQRDAAELLSFARAIWNRSAMFPSPSRYGVQPHVEAAQPVKRSDKKFTAPWTVNVTIAISGDDKKCAAWGENVYARNRGEQE